jgi:hypothetical protein
MDLRAMERAAVKSPEVTGIALLEQMAVQFPNGASV